MVAYSRAPLGPRSLRALNEPLPITVESDAAGDPCAVRRAKWPKTRPVEVTDRWRIDDEWWRARAVSRLYFVVTFSAGAALTIYHDLIADEWFEQHG